MMRLAVIGTGKMGRALVTGILSKKIELPENITGVSKGEDSRKAFLALDPTSTLQWTSSLSMASAEADVLLLCVKPFQIKEILSLLALPSNKTLILSIAAGIKLSTYETALGANRPIARAMPNTPVTLGLGVTAYAPNASCAPEHLLLIEKIFQAVGLCYCVPEEKLDAITAVSGSGPAFFYRIIEAYTNAAVEEGLEPEQALQIVTQTALGAAAMIQQSGLTPQELVNQVVSKGGTTEAGLQVLDQSSIRAILKDTVHAAAEQSRFLSKA